MKKCLCLLICILFAAPAISFAEKPEVTEKAAFIRNGFLWTKINGKEERITTEMANYPVSPQWSHDGKWILYQKENRDALASDQIVFHEIWVYNLQTKKHRRIFYNGENPKWSPTENMIAFQSDGVLNISNLEEFKNVAAGVDDYQWMPNGEGFIASASASLKPDGWTNPILYKILLEKKFQNIDLPLNAKPFFTIPKELSNGKVSIISINASDFAFSPDSKWISFIVSPTASWSMDSDMVCVISADGKGFAVLDETILHIRAPKWAPHRNLLSYIAGGGRIVFGFKNKQLKVTELPAYTSADLTPPHFAELDFTWKNDDTLIVSRVPEKEWSNNSEKRPEPSLYMIKMKDNKQLKITSPPKGLGDYQPNCLKQSNKITWLRTRLAARSGDLWIADPNGDSAKVWIKNVEGYAIY